MKTEDNLKAAAAIRPDKILFETGLELPLFHSGSLKMHPRFALVFYDIYPCLKGAFRLAP
jgi:hypothetical protein